MLFARFGTFILTICLGLVVLTAAAGYAIAPAPMVPIALMCTVLGTTLCSASANSLNQVCFFKLGYFIWFSYYCYCLYCYYR